MSSVTTNKPGRRGGRLLARLYGQKADGAIRAYDSASVFTRVLAFIVAAVCVGMIAVSVFPIIWVILAGFKDIKEVTRSATIIPASFDISRYGVTWGQMKFARYYLNSGLIVLGGAFCAVIFNGSLAYALGVLKPPGHKIIFGLVMWSLLIPPTTGIVAQYVNIRHVLDFVGGVMHVKPQESIISLAPLWLIMGANAFWLVLFKEFFEGLPRDYIEAAWLDGCSDLRIFTSIVLPLSRPIIIVVVIFAATAAWSDFLLPNLLLNNSKWETVMVRLFEFRTAIKVTDVDRLRAVVFSILPPIVLFAAFQKQITNGVTAGGIKG